MPAYGNAVLPTGVRTYMLAGHTTTLPPANEYDECLANEKQAWDAVIQQGLMRVCCPQGREPYALKPWIAMPDSGRRFKEVGSLLVASNIPLVGDTTFPILSFKVPVGYDGVIDTVISNVVPQGGIPTNFVEGSGQIVWRVAADAISKPRYLRNLGNLKYSLGSLLTPIPTPLSSLRIYSGDLITFYADLFSGSGIDPTATILCSLSGWYYAR